jgi:hypothetical protein
MIAALSRMRIFLILSLMVLSLATFEKPAEAGFFRMGPIRRFLFFGGPIRRRMFGRPMMRRPFCGNCMPRRIPRRCGPGIHGGGCFGPNSRDFRQKNFRNFQNFNGLGNPLQRLDQFNSTFDPGLGLTAAPALQTSAVVANPDEDFRKKFLAGIEPQVEGVTDSSWGGFCQSANGTKRDMIFALPKDSKVTQRDRSLFFKGTNSEELFLRTNEEKSELYVMRRIQGQRNPEEFCQLEKR